MKTKEEFESVEGIVELLLKNEERCRNDDKYLTFRVMQQYTKIYIPFEDFKKIPAFETIKRARAKKQNKEMVYLPTDEDVLKKRKLRQEDIKEWAK